MTGRTLVACQLLWLGVGLALQAQSPPLRVTGRVVRVTTRAPQPSAAVQVILHRIGVASAGPVDSMVTDNAGRYRFRVDQPDSTAIYLPTTRHHGIAYFASPARAGDTGAGEIEVFDTTSSPVRLRIVGRHIVVSAPDADGRREMVEVYELQNDSVVTRVGTRDRPGFVAPLPPGAVQLSATRGDFTGEAVVAVPQGLAVTAPIAPGIRQLAFSYQLPAEAFPLSVILADTSGVVEILLEEPGARVGGDSLPALGAVASEGRNFVRYLGRDVPTGKRFMVEVGAPSGATGGTHWGWLVGLGALSLGGIAWTLSRHPSRRVAVLASTPQHRARELREAIRAVDLMLTNHEAAEASRESLTSYRDQMEGELNRLLAAPQDAP